MQHESSQRLFIGRLKVALLFAVSVAAGASTVQIAKGTAEEKPESDHIAQVGFIVEENETDDRALTEIRADDVPDMQPIVDKDSGRPEVMAQRLSLRPSNSALLRQSSPHQSLELAQHAAPTFGSPIEDPFLTDEVDNLTSQVPGEDLLSELITKATSKGITIEDVGIEAIMNLSGLDEPPLTIDQAVQPKSAALPNSPIEALKSTNSLRPTQTQEPRDKKQPKVAARQLQLTEPKLKSPSPKLPTPAPSKNTLETASIRKPPTQRPNTKVAPPTNSIPALPLPTANVRKPAIKAPIAPSVSSLRKSVEPATDEGVPNIANVVTERATKAKSKEAPVAAPSESVFSVNELLKDMEEPPKPDIDESEIEVVEPIVDETPVPSQRTPEKPNETSSATKSKTTTPEAEAAPKSVKSQPPIQYTVPPEPNVVITRKMAAIQPKIAKTLRFYFDRPLNTKDDSAWSVMHSILGYGQNGMVAINGKKGRRTNAVNWMCSNNLCMNRQLLYLDRGYIKGLEGPGFQGHPAQFLAMMAQINLRRDYPVQVQGYQFKLEDLINSEMYTCSASGECTFKLIALSHYLHSDAKWRNEQGEIWSIPKLLEIELAQPVNGAACGGTHRVMSICYAVRTRERRGEPLDGIYVRAHKYMRDYQRYAMSLQNGDGSFSSDWYKRRSDWGDKDRQLQTTGHLLEWLVYSLPRNELSDPRIVKSVEFLTNLMTRHRYHDWEVGPRGHAIRALALYHQRVFERQPSSIPVARLGALPAEVSLLR